MACHQAIIPITIWSFDIERFDIEPRETGEGREGDMDALTSFELEAQRRREIVASDRDLAWARAIVPTESIEPATRASSIVRADVPARLVAEGDCQPGPLARQSVG